MSGRAFIAAFSLIAFLSGDLAGAAQAADAASENSWSVGEKLTYKLSFGMFKAGTAVYAIEKGPEMDGIATTKFTSKMTSGKMFFYKIDDLMTSISAAKDLRTLKYEKRQREGDYKNDEYTLFDHSMGIARRNDDGNLHEPMNFTQNAKDVLAAIYHVRNQKFDGKSAIKFPVHDGRRDYTMEIQMLKPEKIKTPVGEFDCIVIHPKMYNAQGPLKKGQMTLWLTNDARRIPVQIKMELKFGSIIGKLEAMEGVKAL